MGKAPKREQKRGGAGPSTGPVFLLNLPPDLLPVQPNLRYQAITVLCKDTPFYSIPEPDKLSAPWPPLGVPKADLAAYALGTNSTPSPVLRTCPLETRWKLRDCWPYSAMTNSLKIPELDEISVIA